MCIPFSDACKIPICLNGGTCQVSRLNQSDFRCLCVPDTTGSLCQSLVVTSLDPGADGRFLNHNLPDGSLTHFGEKLLFPYFSANCKTCLSGIFSICFNDVDCKNRQKLPQIVKNAYL